MTAENRLTYCRLSESMKTQREFCKSLGIEDTSRFAVPFCDKEERQEKDNEGYS